jgi:predicted ester cyclase
VVKRRRAVRVAFAPVLADGHGGRLNLSEWLQAFPHRGEFMGVAPTGYQVETSGVGIDRFSGGKIAELWEPTTL